MNDDTTITRPSNDRLDFPQLPKTPEIAAAEAAMQIGADVRIDTRAVDKQNLGDSGRHFHRHVAIQWEGGVLWLDMMQLGTTEHDEGAHFCIDVRQFRDDDILVGQGVFSIVNGQRAVIENGVADTARATGDGDPGPSGEVVTGHNFNGGFVVSILTDGDGDAKSYRKSGWGVG